MGQLVFQATAGGQTALIGPNPSSNFSLNVPAVNGTLVTTGDTGTVTNTMLASNVYTAPGTIGSGTPNTGAFTSLSASSVTDSGLTAGRVNYNGTGGLLVDSSNLTFDGSTLTTLNSAYTGTLTGGTGIVNLGSGQFYKDASGNVGIGTTAGTTTVSSGLAINNATAANYPGLEIQTAGVTRMYFNANNAASYISSVGTNPLAIYTNGAERMRIDSSGNLLVGTTTSGTSKVQVSQTATGSVAGYYQNTGSSMVSVLDADSGTTNGTYTRYITSGLVRGSVSYNGTLTVYSTTSDQRLKENIVDCGSGLAKLANVKIHAFDWKESKQHTDFGVIAQELYEISPECVVKGDDEKEIEQTWSVDTSGLVPAMIKAIQELNAKLEAQALEIATLKAK